MTNIEEAGSRKSEVGRPKTEDRSRHGPSARGEPAVRGKPPMGIGVSNSNITDLESPPPDTVISTKERSLSNEVVLDNMRFLTAFGMTARGKPGSWLQWDSRVLAAKKTDYEVGVFIPNGDCFAKKEEAGRKSQFSALKGRQAIARGEALGMNKYAAQIAPRSIVVQGDEFAWGKTDETFIFKRNEENVEYRMSNNEYRSEKLKALKSLSRFVGRRQAIAQCEALGLNEHTTQIVPRSTANYDEMVAWDKTDDVEYCEEQKNRSLSSHYIKNGSIKSTKENIQHSTNNIQCKSWKTKDGSWKIKESRPDKSGFGYAQQSQLTEWVSCLPDGSQGFRTAITDVRNGIRTTREKKVAPRNRDLAMLNSCSWQF